MSGIYCFAIMSNFKCLSSGEIEESLYTVREIYSIRLQAEYSM
jgi:hypothetical protein